MYVQCICMQMFPAVPSLPEYFCCCMAMSHLTHLLCCLLSFGTQGYLIVCCDMLVYLKHNLAISSAKTLNKQSRAAAGVQ